MSAVGVNVDNFTVPVCNVFQAIILNDQLCYEVDLEKYAEKSNISRQLDAGFAFIMDYNEDRQVSFTESKIIPRSEEFGLVRSVVESDEEKDAHIYLNTIG